MMRTLVPLVLLVAVGCAAPDVPGTKVGDVGGPSPAFSAESITSGKMVGLSDLKGQVILVDFWATWCGPCRASMPGIDELHRKYESKGLKVMAITAERKPLVERWLSNKGYSFGVYLDRGNAAHDAFGVTAYPSTLVVDRKGNVVFAEIGARKKDVEAAIEKAL